MDGEEITTLNSYLMIDILQVKLASVRFFVFIFVYTKFSFVQVPEILYGNHYPLLNSFQRLKYTTFGSMSEIYFGGY